MAAIMSRPQCVNLSDAGMIRKNDVKPLLLMTWFQDISNPVTDLVIRQYSYSDFNQHDKSLICPDKVYCTPVLQSLWWNYLSIPKLQRRNRWSLGLINNFIPHFTVQCDYLSMLGLKLIHVSKRAPGVQDSFGRSCKWKQVAINRYARWIQHVLYNPHTTNHKGSR